MIKITLKNILILVMGVIIAILMLPKKIDESIEKDKVRFQNYENCILEQYGMSSTEYYSLTGKEPFCKVYE